MCVITEKVLQTYQDAREGADPSTTARANALSKVSRIKAFLLYMSHGATKTSDWRFINNTGRIKR